MKNNYKLTTRLGLLLSCFIMMYTFGLKAQTITLNAVMSGSVTSSDVGTSGDATNICSSCNRGFVKFDLTSIPVGATITSATLNLVAITPSSSSTTTTNKITSTTLDGGTVGAGFYSALSSSTTVYSGSWGFSSLPNLFGMNINATGITRLNTAVGTGQITYGIIRGSTNVYTFGGYNNAVSTNQPQLIVNYAFPCSGTPTAGTISGASSVCTGTGTTLTLTGASSGPGISYQWASSTTSGGPYTNMGTATTQGTGTLTGTMYYIVTTTCSAGGLTATTAQQTVTVNALPTVIVSPTTASLCQPGGTPITLTASGASTYSWSPGGGLSATTGAVVTASPTADRTYTVTGTDASGCTATATAAITVSVGPTLTATASPNAVCIGASSNLNVTATVPTTYVVTNIPFAPIATPGTGVTTLADAGVAITPQASGTLDDGDWENQSIPFGFNLFGTVYNSFAVSTNGFIVLGAGAPNTYTDYDNAFPYAFAGSPSIGPDYADLDLRTAGTINYFTTGVAPNRMFVVNYIGGQYWSSGGGVGSLTTQIILYETTNVIEVHTTTATGDNDGVEGIQNQTGTVAYTVPGRNSEPWSVSTPDAYRFTPDFGTFTYAWSPATFLSSTSISNPVATAITASTTYTVTVTSAATGCTNTASVAIAAGSLLTSTSTISSRTICAGISDTLNVIPLGGGAPYTYAWSGPASYTSTAQSPVLVPTVASSGTYTITVTDNCGATSVNYDTLTVNPTPSVMVSPSTALICLPSASPVTLTASGAATYNWHPSAGLSGTTGTSVDASPSATTNYSVIGTDTNGCRDTVSALITVAATPALAITASPMAVCIGDTSQLNVHATIPPTYIVTSIPFAPIATPGTGVTTLCDTGTVVVTEDEGSLDDGAWINQTIPFSFNFYGTNYTSFSVATNGFMTLGSGFPPTDQGYGNAFPSTSASYPVIGSVYADLDLGQSGTINYFTTGTAPNRMFVVNWISGQYYAGFGTPAGTVTTQIILYETTNVIEVHTTTATGEKNGVEGVQNETGTIASTVPGRNSDPWSVSAPDAYRFTPDYGTYTYVWSPATFLTSTSIANPLAETITASTNYTVVVTEISGCSATDSVMVSAGVPLTTTSTLSAPSSCSGFSDTLNVTTVGGGAPFTYAWSGPASFTSTAQSPFIMATPATAGTYSVTVTDHCGGTSLSQVTLTVNPHPSVTVSPTSAQYCNPGTPVTLTASGAGVTAFDWSPSTGLSATTGASVDASPSATTAYMVIGTDANGCTDTATTAINVSPTPLLTVTATPASVCTIGNSQLLAAAALPSTTYTVSNIPFAPISLPGTGVTTLCNGGVETTPLAGGTLDDGAWGNQTIPFSFNFFGISYTSFGVSTNGFIFLGTGAPTTFSGYGDPLPSTFSAHPCIGPDYADMDLEASGTINYFTAGTAPNRMFVINFTACQYYDYSGTSSTGAIGSLTTQVILYESTNVIEVHTTAASGDNDGVEGIQDAPGLNAYTVAGRNSEPWSVTTTSDAYRFAPPTTSYTYAWTPPTFLSSISAANPVATNINVTTPYTVTVTAASGCVATGNVTVAVNPTPTAPIASGTIICSGTTASLTATGADILTWYNSGGTPVAGGGSFITPALTATTTYYVHDSTTLGCVSTTPVIVTVDSIPAAAYTYSTALNVVSFTNTSNAGGATTGLSYNWSFGDATPNSTAANPVHTYATTGIYNVQLIITTPCGVDTIIHQVIITAVGIQENELGGISIYPNPTSGSFNITMTNSNFTELNISIVDLQGKVVYSALDKNITANYTKQINLEDLAKGIYYIKLNTNTGVKIQKLVIQ